MYHIMTRGNHRADIFKEQEDYESYLQILEVTKRKFPFYLLSYCLMTNHVHLQIQTTSTGPGQIMKHINSIYTQYMNHKYHLVGHLFQGRYHSEIIESDAYALQTSRYIHLNPVKAKMVETPIEYPWSSYGAYMGQVHPWYLDEALILDYFKINPREQYRAFVEAEVVEAGDMDFLEDREVD